MNKKENHSNTPENVLKALKQKVCEKKGLLIFLGLNSKRSNIDGKTDSRGFLAVNMTVLSKAVVFA